MRWKLLAGLALSAVFLWLAFREARFEEILASLRSAEHIWVVPAVGLTLVCFAIRAWRWRFLLAGVAEIPFAKLWAATMVGFMGNNVLPARLGELLRVHSIGKTAGISRSAALASIVVERIFDVGVLLFLFTTVLVAGRLPEDVRGWGVYLVAAAAPALAGIVVLRVRPQWFLSLLDRFAPRRFRDRLKEIVVNFHDGIGIIGRARESLIAAALSLLMWGSLVGVVVMCFAALDLALPPEAGVVALVVMAVGTMIPSAPGFIGTLQFAGVLALRQYGVGDSLALSFTIIFHATQWFPVTAVGLYYFLRQQIQIGKIDPVTGSRPLRAPSMKE